MTTGRPPADVTTGRPPADGVDFPLIDGSRSTSATGRAAFAAAARTVDHELAHRIEGERRWHQGYLAHLRALVAADLRSGDPTEAIPRAGLDALRARLTVSRDGQQVPLHHAFELPARPRPRSATVDGAHEAGPPELTIPYRGRLLTGDALRSQLARWVERGRIEPSCAAAVSLVVDEPERLDLRGRTVVLLGAGAEMGPLTALSRWGATIVPVDLPVPELWRRILDTVRSGRGRAIVPLHREPDGDDLAAAAGFDLSTGFPELATWIADLDGPLTIGTYAYAHGSAHVRVTLAADAVIDHLLSRRDDVSLACLLTPTDVYAAPADVVEDARSRGARTGVVRRAGRAVTGGRAFAPNYPETVAAADGRRYGLADCLVAQQGPNYALAKRAQRWRMRVARHDGVLVSANIAPATRTRSVTSNRILAAAYAGAPRYDVEVFEPETSAALEASLLARDLTDPDAAGNPATTLSHPLALFADAAAHGGLWRQPFSPRSVLPAAALRGLVPPRPRID